MNIPEVLRRFDLFRPFLPAQLQRIADRAEHLELAANQVIFQAGDYSPVMYLILAGKVRIHRNDDQGDIIEVGVLEADQAFGELALLSTEPRLATATTLTDSEFLVINRDSILDAIRDATPETILQMFAVLSNQIRATYERNFQGLLAQHTLEAHLEAERQRSLTQMVAGVAHEINTPLGIISTAVSILEREVPHLTSDRPHTIEDIQESIGLMRKHIERAHRLIQDFKKVSVSQLSDVREPMNLPEAIHEIIGLAEIQLRKSAITIQFDNQLSAENQTWVGYRGYLSQVLLNLLTNIERYAYQNGGAADVSLTLDGADHYRLTVRDYGKGMSEEAQARIFEPFFTTGRAVGGTGLGMTIVHNLVTDALSGDIDIQSAPGQGTEISVTFPRVVPA